MNSEDKLTADELSLLRDMLEASFRDMAAAHDAALEKAVNRWQQHSAAGEDENAPALLEAAMHAHAVARVIKAMMWARYPAGSLDWFGRDEEV